MAMANLNEMRHRLYSSDMRQFLSMDPLGLIDSVDEWLFVRGDPINFSDPFGLAAEMATTPTGGPAWDPLIESSPETRAMEQEVWGGGHEASNPLAGVPRQVGPIWPAPRLDGGIHPAIGVPDENPVTLASDQVRSVQECMSLGGGQAFQRCMGGTHTSQDQLRRQHEAVGEHMEENRTGYTVDIASAGLWPAILGGLATLSRLRGLWRSNPLSRRDVRRIANEYGTTPERAQLLERVIQRDGSINVSQTVARQLAPGGSRSHIPTQSILATIGSGTRTADPQGVAGQFMYRAPARFNDGSGTLEVLVDEVSGQVRHVLYAR